MFTSISFTKFILMFNRKASMPTFAIALFAAASMMTSCGGPKTVATADRKDIKGNWMLNNINYEGLNANDKVKITLLDEGNSECLTGSTWTFPNNSNGSYTINSTAAGCTAGRRDIVWGYRSEQGRTIVQYKKLVDGVKPKNIEDGYRFTVVSADNSQLHLQSEVSFEGKPLFINYYFTKQ